MKNKVYMCLFVHLTVCISLQERAHFEGIGHHLNKLGEEGKIGHRVIDLTRPEDLDGKPYLGFFLLPSPNTLLSLNTRIFCFLVTH